MDAEDRLKSLELEKERMIREYLSLQDEADSVNEKIFKVCCHVEDLNRKIKTARDVLSRELPQKRKVVKSRK